MYIYITGNWAVLTSVGFFVEILLIIQSCDFTSLQKQWRLYAEWTIWTNFLQHFEKSAFFAPACYPFKLLELKASDL